MSGKKEHLYGFVRAYNYSPFRYYLLTLWIWALLQMPPVVQPLKNLPTLHGTRTFITAFTRALHLSLSWARPIQSISPYRFSKIHLNIIRQLRLSLSGLFPSGFPTKNLKLRQEYQTPRSGMFWETTNHNSILNTTELGYYSYRHRSASLLRHVSVQLWTIFRWLHVVLTKIIMPMHT
jgi:hypothetical protein